MGINFLKDFDYFYLRLINPGQDYIFITYINSC